ncbi:MAG TPA: DUF6308 family protein [Mycobacteriales bacterium]|nr:DUF6308 family protein [Mycobacteriales bacterium]
MTITLCGGNLEIDDPDDLLLAYLDRTAGYAWPSYDELVTNSSPELVDSDLLAPVLMGVHLDLARFTLLRAMLPDLQTALAALPPTALQDTDDAGVELVAQCFADLDHPRYAEQRVRGTILSKVLHRKRPDLVPLYDSRIWTAYTATGAVPRSGRRTWVEFMTLLCAQMREELRAEREEMNRLVGVAAGAGATLTPLRLLDILVWMSAEPH